MWIFTTTGFFSITRSKEQPDKLQFRARVKADIVALRRKFKIKAKLIETPHADYRWRVVLGQWKAARVMGALFREIDYSNFKSAMADTGVHTAKLWGLHNIWEIHNGWQRRPIERETPEKGAWLFADDVEEARALR